jgi:hypothetical protein
MQYPLHMITTDSVDQFSKDVPKDEELKLLDPGRFRANIIRKLKSTLL